MSSLYGMGMIHLLQCRKAFIKAKWAGVFWETAKQGRHPGGLMHGWAWTQEVMIHLACCWLEFAVVFGMGMVCVWGTRPLVGCGRGSGFNIVTHFPSGWPKRGECDGKPWWEVLPLLSRNGGEWKNHHQNFEVQKNWTTAGNQSTWHLPQLAPANVDFSSSFWWSIWRVLTLTKISGTLWSHTALAADVSGCDQRHLSEGGRVWQCWLRTGAARWELHQPD